MADIQINQAAITTTVATLLGVSRDGTLNRITFENLMGNNFYNRGIISSGDANDCIKSGLYMLGSGIGNIPADCAWSDLIVFAGYAILQITYSKTNFKLYARMYSKGGSESWTKWYTISIS